MRYGLGTQVHVPRPYRPPRPLSRGPSALLFPAPQPCGPSAPFSQLHVSVHRRQAHSPAALAEGGAEVAGVDAAGDGHGPVGLEAAVHRAQLDVGVDVLAEFGDDAAVDGREIEVAVAGDLPHASVDAAVHAARLDRAAAARRVDGAVDRAGFHLARRAIDAHLAVHRPGAEVDALRQPHLEVHRDVVVAVVAALTVRAVAALRAGRVLGPEGAYQDAAVGRLAALDAHHLRIAVSPGLRGDD